MKQVYNKQPLSYADSGVSIDEGDAFIRAIKPLAQSTTRAGSFSAIGGFAGLFDLKAAGFTDPLLVSGADGVGTKIKLALDAEDLSTIGIDLVAMCVNDILANGAEPLFFLDYLATGALKSHDMLPIIAGIAEGCKQANALLIGGETAEMPGLYHDKDFDLAGFALGAVERENLLPKTQTMLSGDRLIALPSSGLHSNGFSLVRKIISAGNHDIKAQAPFDSDKTLAEALLAPTKIYVNTVLPLIKSKLIKGLAHITGGGITDNVPRAIPDTMSAIIDANSIPIPSVFHWLCDEGLIKPEEMLRTFNCGVGMVLIAGHQETNTILDKLAPHNPFILGTLSEQQSNKKLHYHSIPTFTR